MIYICLPVYNEAPTVGLVLWRIQKVLASYSREYELLVVDDASDDATSETLESYARLLPLTVTRNETRRGYAAAVDSLLRAASAATRHPRRDAIVLMQADFTDPPEQLPELIKRFEGGVDLVVAETEPLPLALPRGIRWLRRFGPRLLGSDSRIPGIVDPLGSYRLVRIATVRDALREAGDQPVTSGAGWSANAELTRRLARFSRRTETVRVAPRYDLRPRPSRVRPLSGALELFKYGRTQQSSPANPS
jgi:glycosyltransferase involved in cell wall biosynthesis